jgi:hypothetical protein
MLTHDERALLFGPCHDHEVASCSKCRSRFRFDGLTFQLDDLSGDPFPGLATMCPTCRVDLSPAIRQHLVSCAVTGAFRSREAPPGRNQASDRYSKGNSSIKGTRLMGAGPGRIANE